MSLQLNRLFWFFCGFAVAAASWMGALAFIRDKPVPNAIFSQSIIDCKIEAASLAEAWQGPKTFLVGGSSVAFGIDSQKIETALGSKVVNFGCMAGIGPEMILGSINPRLSSGDRVLFCWEYGLYRFKRRHEDITYLNLIFGPQNRLFLTYPLIDRLYLGMTLPIAHVRESFAHHINPYADREIYKCGWEFDSSGNVRSNLGTVTTVEELNERPLGSLLTKLTISTEVRGIISEFLSTCRNQGVEVLATWPNIYAHPDYIDKPTVTENIHLIRDFWVSFDVPVVGKAEDAMLGAEFFYDTMYHLNAKGVAIRTDRLIEDLRPWLVGSKSAN